MSPLRKVVRAVLLAEDIPSRVVYSDLSVPLSALSFSRDDEDDKEEAPSSAAPAVATGPNFSTHFYGGKQPRWFHGWDLRGPEEKLHGGRKRGNWQSDRAWDIAQDPGTPVYALTNGTVTKIKDYGHGDPKIFGIAITVKGDAGFPDVWYTHTANPVVSVGSRVAVGQRLAEIAYWTIKPGSSHVHFAMRTGYVSDLMEKDGRIKSVSASPGPASSSSRSAVSEGRRRRLP